MNLPADKKKYFRSIGQKLNPVVTVAGKGLSENVLLELERALEDHELIKIRVSILDREIRKALIQELCDKCKAELVQEIGKVALIYRAAKKADANKSNLQRPQ